ncbi:MAG: SDR family NAD(P)-dependent oxidoreductase [Treponema sp.]|jgi:sorbitol-6-phosphate 2-dehydrogenase|nr:SDR family NAD(P)-dependent oxidoreductase [Treponema sp.]
MNKAIFFAPLLRGAFIEKSRRPWIIRATDTTGNTMELPITVTAKERATEEIPAALEASSFVREHTLPLRISIRSGGTEYRYLCAPDFSGIERILRGEQLEAWDIKSIDACSGECQAHSRADVVRDKLALITGGAQGFGEEITRGLAAAGALVFIADLNMTGAERLAQGINGEYGKTVAFPVKVNVADEESVQAMTEQIALEAGGLDLCVSNAGVLRASSILEQDIASFRFVTEVNYTAFAIVSKYCGLLMKAQHETAPSWLADIVQVNSKSGLEGSNKNGSYAGSKFGGIGLVQSFAKELVEYGIKVNAICPGNFFDGPLWSDPEKGLFVQYLKTGKVSGAKTIADVKSFYEAKVPMNRGCMGKDVLRAILYLIEQEYETGQALPVTGGQVMLS